MTTEEKAKAYETALEAARKELGVDRKEWEVVQRVLHNIFPELRESEDEITRKRLINLIRELASATLPIMTGGYFIDGQDKRYIAYLEKQKEEEGYESIPVKSTLEYKLGFADGRDYEKQKEQKPVVTHGETYHTDTLGTQQVIAGKMPQKPAEWSEEDKAHIVSLLERLEGMCKYGATFTQTRFAVSEDMDWLKSLRHSWKPNEWNREDRNRHTYLCDLLRETWDKVDKGSCIDDAISWLEELPTRVSLSSWKPSEEQMDALLSCSSIGTLTHRKALKSLYNDLKKL